VETRQAIERIPAGLYRSDTTHHRSRVVERRTALAPTQSWMRFCTLRLETDIGESTCYRRTSAPPWSKFTKARTDSSVPVPRASKSGAVRWPSNSSRTSPHRQPRQPATRRRPMVRENSWGHTAGRAEPPYGGVTRRRRVVFGRSRRSRSAVRAARRGCRWGTRGTIGIFAADPREYDVSAERCDSKPTPSPPTTIFVSYPRPTGAASALKPISICCILPPPLALHRSRRATHAPASGGGNASRDNMRPVAETTS